MKPSMLNSCAELERVMSDSEKTASRGVGDLAIGFRTRPPRSGRLTAAPPESLATGREWELWAQPSNPAWKGFPLKRIETSGWHVLVLGEMYGQDSGRKGLELVGEVVRGE